MRIIFMSQDDIGLFKDVETSIAHLIQDIDTYNPRTTWRRHNSPHPSAPWFTQRFVPGFRFLPSCVLEQYRSTNSIDTSHDRSLLSSRPKNSTTSQHSNSVFRSPTSYASVASRVAQLQPTIFLSTGYWYCRRTREQHLVRFPHIWYFWNKHSTYYTSPRYNAKSQPKHCRRWWIVPYLFHV